MLDRAKLKDLQAAGPLGPRTLTDTLPYWGEVTVRKVTAGERDRYEVDTFDPKANPELTRARWIRLCVIDTEGKAVFGEDEMTWLAGQDFELVQPLFLLCQRANGLLVKDDELKKNSKAPS